MISLEIIMLEEHGNSPTQRRLAEKDHSRKTFMFETSERPFQMSVQIGTPWWEAYRCHVFVLENLSKRLAELSVPVHNQVSRFIEKAILLYR
jgi:hypothetical protein